MDPVTMILQTIDMNSIKISTLQSEIHELESENEMLKLKIDTLIDTGKSNTFQMSHRTSCQNTLRGSTGNTLHSVLNQSATEIKSTMNSEKMAAKEIEKVSEIVNENVFQQVSYKRKNRNRNRNRLIQFISN
jgi:hypothetical protein